MCENAVSVPLLNIGGINMDISSISFRHFPVVGAVLAFFLLYQLFRGEAYFGFPGEAPFERDKQPVTYWTLIGVNLFAVLAISYSEIWIFR
jgi:hypothetical protein